jgi:hypothetical protein
MKPFSPAFDIKKILEYDLEKERVFINTQTWLLSFIKRNPNCLIANSETITTLVQGIKNSYNIVSDIEIKLGSSQREKWEKEL